MITPDRTKQIFIALRLHFTSSYDYVKYQGKTNAKPKPNEQWALERIRKKYLDEDSMRDFFVANMMFGYLKKGKIDSFINNYSTKECADLHELWASWWNSCGYNLKKDISKIGSVKEMIEVKDNEHPKVFTEFLDGNVSFNTIACLTMGISSLIDYWEKNCDDTILFGSHLDILKKYTPLISKDRSQIRDIIQKSKEN